MMSLKPVINSEIICQMVEAVVNFMARITILRASSCHLLHCHCFYCLHAHRIFQLNHSVFIGACDFNKNALKISHCNTKSNFRSTNHQSQLGNKPTYIHRGIIACAKITVTLLTWQNELPVWALELHHQNRTFRWCVCALWRIWLKP